jgi:hypothetical protein
LSSNEGFVECSLKSCKLVGCEREWMRWWSWEILGFFFIGFVVVVVDGKQTRLKEWVEREWSIWNIQVQKFIGHSCSFILSWIEACCLFDCSFQSSPFSSRLWYRYCVCKQNGLGRVICMHICISLVSNCK